MFLYGEFLNKYKNQFWKSQGTIVHPIMIFYKIALTKLQSWILAQIEHKILYSKVHCWKIRRNLADSRIKNCHLALHCRIVIFVAYTLKLVGLLLDFYIKIWKISLTFSLQTVKSQTKHHIDSITTLHNKFARLILINC